VISTVQVTRADDSIVLLGETRTDAVYAETIVDIIEFIMQMDAAELDQTITEIAAGLTDTGLALSNDLGLEGRGQYFEDISERKEMFVAVSDMEEVLNYPLNPNYRYTFVLPLDDSNARNSLPSNCSRCGQRLNSSRLVRQMAGWAISCPGSIQHNDQSSIYQDVVFTACPRGCTGGVTSIHGPELYFVNCSQSDPFLATGNYRVRVWQFWADSGFNPHECWHIFNRGSFWDSVPFWRR
jgi:hypothetical protein